MGFADLAIAEIPADYNHPVKQRYSKSYLKLMAEGHEQLVTWRLSIVVN
ncbi:hypothetical protein [Fortiea contorta]|nr:hypothetical protein [Fortiea contorta]